MKDLNRLNDELDPSEAPVSNFFAGWGHCYVPVLCIYQGQVPTKDDEDVIIHNFMHDPGPSAELIKHVAEVEEPKVTGIKDQGYFADDEVEDLQVVVIDEEEEVQNCMNCTFKHLGIQEEPCDGCFDRNEWEGMPFMDVDNEGMPAPVESLYRQGCWRTLENKLHDLMSEWSLLASKCRYASDETECMHKGNMFMDCDYSHCPRIDEQL